MQNTRNISLEGNEINILFFLLVFPSVLFCCYLSPFLHLCLDILLCFCCLLYCLEECKSPVRSKTIRIAGNSGCIGNIQERLYKIATDVDNTKERVNENEGRNQICCAGNILIFQYENVPFITCDGESWLFLGSNGQFFLSAKMNTIWVSPEVRCSHHTWKSGVAITWLSSANG